jgi:prephenate dehydratase
MKIAFQGERGSNSDEACRAEFPDHEPLPCASFEAAFEAMQTGQADLGLIPMENSLAGRVADVHHLLPDAGLRIIGERFRRIHFQLMVNPGVTLDRIEVISSHVMALGQCRKLIRRLGARTEIASDTAGAARLLAETPDPVRAVLAPALAAELYGLDILERRVEDEPHNTTRFLVMTARTDTPPPPEGQAAITSFVFRVRNIPAALFKVLSGFATNGVNMLKLESYMEAGRFTATLFYAEVEGRPDDPALARAFEELAFFSDRRQVLGVYAADPFRADLEAALADEA